MSKSFFSDVERNEIELCLRGGGDVRIECHPDTYRFDPVVRYYPAAPFDATARYRALGRTPAESKAVQGQADLELNEIKKNLGGVVA